MPHESKPEMLKGRLDGLLFSPKGTIEGFLMTVDSRPVQVSMKSGAVPVNEIQAAVQSDIEVKAVVDESPKTKDRAHPVYQLKAITKIAGKPVKTSEPAKPIRGIVAAIHYAKHGAPNGVILKSGEFIHTRPDGMKKLKLALGSEVIAQGEMRMTVLGTPLIEAHEVNRLSLE